VRAVVWAGLPGFAGGTAIADVLSGAVNPSGRLAFSYPSTPGHMVGYHHKPSDQSTALYPFGHGLSYTRFGYRDLELSDAVVRPGNALDVTVRISNDGSREGREAVLWFLTDEVGRVTRPVARLASYEKISLAPGASKTVSLHITPDALAYPDERGRPVLEDGWYTLRVGSQSARFQLRQ